MASIVIKDLAASAELDRSALASIAGGSSASNLTQSATDTLKGKGSPIELTARSTGKRNQRLKHSKCVRD